MEVNEIKFEDNTKNQTNSSVICLPSAQIDLLAKAFFLQHDFSLKLKQDFAKMYFFYVSGFPINSWRSFSKQIFLNMSEKKPLSKKPLASHHRPVLIVKRNYFYEFTNDGSQVKLNSNNLKLNKQDHIFGLMYFPSNVDQLSESKIRGRIESGNYMGMQPGQIKD